MITISRAFAKSIQVIFMLGNNWYGTVSILNYLDVDSVELC